MILEIADPAINHKIREIINIINAALAKLFLLGFTLFPKPHINMRIIFRMGMARSRNITIYCPVDRGWASIWGCAWGCAP